MTDLLGDIDARLERWVQASLDDVEVSFDLPGAASTDRCINLHLMEIDRPTPGVGGAVDPPLRLELRYLVTAWDRDPREAHRLLGTLLIGALEADDLTVEHAAPALPAWAALGVAPRPAFVLRAQASHQPATRIARPVTEYPIVGVRPTGPLSGVVHAHDVPLSGAVVRLPNLGRRVVANARGEFHFDAIPVDPPPRTLCIDFKGERFFCEVEAPLDSDSPLLVEVPLP